MARDGSGDVISEDGNLISQTVDSDIEPQEEAFGQVKAGQFALETLGKCPDDTREKNEGDPFDVLPTEDPDNDPANDGCNPPVCPTPSPCDNSGTLVKGDCVASVKVFKQFFGLKFFGKAIVTETNVDLYCFNSNEAARLFFNKMIIIMDAQPKPQLGDTQIKLNNLSIIFSPTGECNDTAANPREDAALVNFIQYGPLTLFGPKSPQCDTVPGDPDVIPPTDPCEPPEYLTS